MSITARASGFLKVRSGRVNSASALAVRCPGASFATSAATTGSPAQGLAVRSCDDVPCACFGAPPGSGMATTSGGAAGRSFSRSSACTEAMP